MIARAVIGSLYGDEGKGLMTDFFAREAMRDHGSCTVVRSNGGAQAGHTVVTPDGQRHVFHHFGSGTLTGASTHLSEYMIVNPIMFNREWDELVALGITPVVTVSPDCLVTFPQDMLINQMLETIRGGARHGSCGMGVGETAARAENNRDDGFRLGSLITSVDYRFFVEGALDNLRNSRLKELNLTLEDIPEEFRIHLQSSAIWNSFWEDCDNMFSRVTVLEDADVDTSKPIIFEGAQGLALDRDMGWFPYVTRSKTGLFNITKLCKTMGIHDLEVVYTMRAYTTRHGAGPLDGEGTDMSSFSIVDETNHPNDWQGSIRTAPLDLWLVNRLVTLDMVAASKPGLTITKSIAVTCLDQVPDMETVPVFDIDRVQRAIPKEELWDHVMQGTNAQRAWVSYGPTRKDVVQTY